MNKGGGVWTKQGDVSAARIRIHSIGHGSREPYGSRRKASTNLGGGEGAVPTLVCENPVSRKYRPLPERVKVPANNKLQCVHGQEGGGEGSGEEVVGEGEAEEGPGGVTRYKVEGV